jgi:hypothetical protein
MRKVLPDKLEAGRVRTGRRASDPEWGAYGDFVIQGPCGAVLVITASGGADNDDHLVDVWEHVSVSCKNRCPNWTEMAFVKDLFWEPEECVVQFHVPSSQHINLYPYVLHLWRSKTQPFPMPPPALV